MLEHCPPSAWNRVRHGVEYADTLTQLDYRVGQVTRSHANELAEWVREKQRITGSLKLAVGQAEPLPFLRAAKQAGAFDDTYFV